MAVAEVGIETVAAKPMAAVATVAPRVMLADAIRGELDKVYAVLRAGDYGQLGCNTVFYAKGTTPAAMDLKIGVRLAAPFAGAGEVQAAETPAGEVAHAVYFGDYSQMWPAHEAAKAAAVEAGRRITGDSWEVYGDWSDDWSKVRTDIYWLLEAKSDG
jgi:effector-binding domain-containing protein